MALDVCEEKSWTDDLPVCSHSGVGLSTNQFYKEDGQRKEAHEFEDRSFHFKIDDETFLYGVFDGTEGSSVSDFTAQRMPAEILLGQLTEKSSPTEVKQVLREAFFGVERSYFESIDDLLAERANLLCELPEGIKSYEAYQHYPEIVNQLRAVNARLSSCTSATLALIFKGQLYVANVGHCRACLCQIDSDNVLRVKQLSVDHNLTNEDELLRLSHTGIDIEKLNQNSPGKCSRLLTRCLGNYTVKGGFKDFDLFSTATVEPVIAEAEITGPITLDDSCRFLLLMTQGLYGALEEATRSEQTNKEIAQIVVEQFGCQNTLTGVAQGVVDRIVRLHHDQYMQDPNHVTCCQRDDITLLLRNFNFPLTPHSASNTLRSLYGAHSIGENSMMLGETRFNLSKSCSINSCNDTLTEVSATSSESSEQQPKSNQSIKVVLDEEGKIVPYVDFSSFYEAVRQAQLDGNILKDSVY